MKNKVFFFGNGEVSRRDTPSGTSIAGSGANFGRQPSVDRFLSILQGKYGYNPGTTDEFTRKTDSDKVFVRADFNLNARNQLTVRHNYVKGVNDIGSPTVRSYIFPDNFYQFNSKTNSTVVQLNSTIGQLFNEFRFTTQRIREFRDRPEFATFPQVSVTLPDNSSLRAGREQFSAANALDQDIFELTDDVTLVRGKHTITLGTHNEFYKFRNVFIRDNAGTYSFDSLDLLEAGLAQSYDYSFGAFDTNFAARFKVRQFGVYAGDQWRVRDNLTPQRRRPRRQAVVPRQAHGEPALGRDLRLRHRRHAGPDDVVAARRLQLAPDRQHAASRCAAASACSPAARRTSGSRTSTATPASRFRGCA